MALSSVASCLAAFESGPAAMLPPTWPPPPRPERPPPPATTAPSAPPLRPLTRTLSAASAWSNADVPAASAHDLPEATRLTVLERAPSQPRVGYAGGAGLRRGHTTRRGPVVVGAHGRIDEDAEAHVIEDEVALGEDGETVEETEARAQRMYARFTPQKKRRIVAIVAYAALLARASPSRTLAGGVRPAADAAHRPQPSPRRRSSPRSLRSPRTSTPRPPSSTSRSPSSSSASASFHSRWRLTRVSVRRPSLARTPTHHHPLDVH